MECSDIDYRGICVHQRCSILSFVTLQLLSTQVQHDENVKILVETMRSTFNLIQVEDLLKAIKPNSNQVLILKVMLRHIQLCSEILQHYTKDKQFGLFLKPLLMLISYLISLYWSVKRLARNITQGIAKEIQDLCETLRKLRQDLLDDAVISTQIAVERVQRTLDILPKQVADLGAQNPPYTS